MRRIYICVEESAFRALQRRALKERRDVRDQAALELERMCTGSLRVPVQAPPSGAAEKDDRVPAGAGATT